MRAELAERLRANGREAFYATLPEVGIRIPITPRQWAAKYRRIGRGGSPLSMHGDIGFDESVMPWVAEPMDAAVDPEVSHLVMWWASALGKSDGVVSNLIGWAIAESPRNIMALYPTEAAINKWSRDVLERTINATPVLRERVVEKKGRDAGNTIAYKAFAGGSLYATFAGSPSNLRGPRVGLAYAGEVDAMPVDVGGSAAKPGEGDPLGLLFKRCEGFEDAIKVIEGTGTIAGRSRIEAWYERTDKRRWFVPCRKCGARQVLYWRHVKWPKGKPELAEIECEKCGAMHSDAQRIRMARDGIWKPTAAFSGMRGYWLSGFNTTLPTEKGYRHKIHQFAQEWIDAKHSEAPRERIRTIINTTHAQTDKETGETEPAPEWGPIFARRESYISDKSRALIVPEPVRVLTGGIDVQKDRIELLVEGWSRDEQSWALEHILIYTQGEAPIAENPAAWDALEKAILRRYQHASGVGLEISIAMIDRGRWTDAVDAFAARPALSGKCYTVKGASEMGLPVVGRIRNTGRGGTYFRIGTDAAKEWISGKLFLATPNDGRSFPRGFRHYPQTFEEEFFRQLCAEEPHIVYERGQSFRKFKLKKGEKRNEALDISVYSLAGFRLRRWDWDALDASIAETKEEKREAQTVPREEPRENWITGGRRW